MPMPVREPLVPGWIVLIVAPFVGSFLGTIVRRLPEGISVVAQRSHCDSCGAGLAPRDMVPVLSWVALAGRCRHCGARIDWFYPAVECAALALAAVALWADPQDAWLDSLFGWWLLALGWIDLRRGILPDYLTLPLIATGLIVTVTIAPAQLADHAAAAALAYLMLHGIAWGYRRLRHRDGLGLGDAKLLAAGGAWLGLAALPQILLCAALTGLAAAAILMFAGVRLHAHSALPFGPFLALAIWLSWLLGPLALAAPL